MRPRLRQRDSIRKWVRGSAASFVAWGFVAHGQGTLKFANRLPGVLDAPVFLREADGTLGRPDANYVAQLYASAPGGVLVPVGEAVPFRMESDAARGYWRPEVRYIPGVPEGGRADVQVRCWDQRYGGSYEAVAESGDGTGTGTSKLLQVRTGDDFSLPQPLFGLESFTIASRVVPEPDLLALCLVGWVTLACLKGSGAKRG